MRRREHDRLGAEFHQRAILLPCWILGECEEEQIELFRRFFEEVVNPYGAAMRKWIRKVGRDNCDAATLWTERAPIDYVCIVRDARAILLPWTEPTRAKGDPVARCASQEAQRRERRLRPQMMTLQVV